MSNFCISRQNPAFHANNQVNSAIFFMFASLKLLLRMNRNQPVKTLVDKIWNDQSYGNSIKQNVAFIDILQENRLDLFMIVKSYFFLSFRNYKNEKKGLQVQSCIGLV
ncbi:MAG: hypothetical protein K9I02_00760 [Haliscomenobacter sp.]|nr:hypothetical protein [Haliscomenobacter sp.]